MRTLFDVDLNARCRITPRDYQQADHDEAFRLWDKGHRGVLTRAFTGAGKSPMACQKISTWLGRGPDHKVLVVSYETQLVWQFAQEVEDFVGVTPGIEMDKEAVRPDRLPPVVVACRASLLRATPPDPGLLDELRLLGVTEVGACDKRACKQILKYLKGGGEIDLVREQIKEFNARPEVADGFFSRVHKFDWRLIWLVIFDEAHRHAKSLVSVGHIVDWFDRNPESRRYGMTATPKRGDGKNIGHLMFPTISLDYPLFSPTKPCGVRDGWAVPYTQKYIQVEGVDFKTVKRVAGDFDPEDLARKLSEEKALASLVEPLLDMVGDRRTLIFSPGVEMAKSVRDYINARVPADCPSCGKRKWYSRRLVGDGARCPCGLLVEPSWVKTTRPQADAVWGEIPPRARKQFYKEHQEGRVQFLSICSLCREGYNDPDIACVAVFRPVSEKASSLAEQMKGRGCRPLRSLVPTLNATTDAAERCRLIAESAKPNCLVVDLVGITGLADCASTVQIYSEGRPDAVKERAKELLAKKGLEEEVDVEEVIDEAARQIDEEDNRARLQEQERQRAREAELRAKASAEATYTAHDAGVGAQVNPNAASEGQLRFIARLGMDLHGVELTKRQAGRIINLLKLRKPLDRVAAECWLKDGQWSPKGPSVKTLKLMANRGIPHAGARSGYDAGLLIDARLKPAEFFEQKAAEIARARGDDELTAVGHDVVLVKAVLRPDLYQSLVEKGKARRASWQPAREVKVEEEFRGFDLESTEYQIPD